MCCRTDDGWLKGRFNLRAEEAILDDLLGTAKHTWTIPRHTGGRVTDLRM